MRKHDVDELRRLKPVLEHNTTIQNLLAEVRVHLDELLKEREVFEDKIKGLLYKVRRLQGELVSHKTKLKKHIPPELEEAIKKL